VRNVWDRVRQKVTDDQAKRIVLNLDDSPLATATVAKQFKDWAIAGLEEVLVVRGGEVTRIFP